MNGFEEVNTMDDLGMRIYEARRALGLTQAQMAERLCISRNYLVLIENGKRTPGKHVTALIERNLKKL